MPTDLMHYKKVRIWADLDKPTEINPLGAGLSAALELASRLIKQGYEVEVCLPPGSTKMDWDDWYVQNIEALMLKPLQDWINHATHAANNMVRRMFN